MVVFLWDSRFQCAESQAVKCFVPSPVGPPMESGAFHTEGLHLSNAARGEGAIDENRAHFSGVWNSPLHYRQFDHKHGGGDEINRLPQMRTNCLQDTPSCLVVLCVCVAI